MAKIPSEHIEPIIKLGSKQSVSFTLSSTTAGGITYYYGIIDVTPTPISGYTPIGVASYALSHFPNEIVGINRVSATSYRVWIFNPSSASISDSFSIQFIYAKNDYLG